MKRKLFAAFSALMLACSLPLTATFAASTNQFSDVPPSKYFAEAVYDLAERNIIGGYPDGTFKPGNSITRGQAAAIIAKLIKLDTAKVKDPKFKDVTTANGFYKAIAAMAEKGIIRGYGDGRFGPNDPITRGQMASILVKAFDLPRYDYSSHKNPFEDVKTSAGHNPNILIIHRLGITGGTTPTTFSPNVAITRGQAAKMMQATEEAKSQIVTLRASDFNWEQFKMYDSNHSDSGLFNAVAGSNELNGRTSDKLHLVPLKEGTGTLQVALVYSGNPDKKYYRKYYITIKEVDGKLKLSLEETQDFLTTPAVIDVKNKKAVQNVSLYTMDGTKLSDRVDFTKCLSYSPSDCKNSNQTDPEGKYNNIRIGIEKPGRYIAIIRDIDGEEVRYGIEAVSLSPHFNYSIRVLEEKTTDSVDLGASYHIGNHILPKGSEEIAMVTRAEGTNEFTVEGKKKGSFTIKLPDHKKTDLLGVEVYVEQLGPIINVNIYEDIDMHM
ncbi:S-layer homology domain-containing protein [Solibacillus sp. FSL K6-4121]|uniref:S-layer homology domain-containing protein n=1 Tax=Solibacillus sp. FSL K6-4121 TaxID=2921505 RepID=UPI0030F7E754